MTTLLRRFVLVWPLAVAAVLTPSPGADAASSAYVVTGQLGSSEAPSVIDGGSFAFELLFDDPVEPDPERSDVSSQVLGFSADAWSLDLFDVGGGLVGSFDSTSEPEAVGSATLRGQLTGFDSAQTTISLNVESDLSGTAEARLINAEFFTPRLVDTFFDGDPASLPSSLSFLDGTVLQLEANQQRLPIVSAELSTQSLLDSDPIDIFRDEVTIDSDADNAGAAVPSPNAAGGGLLLLVGVLIASNPRARRLSAIERL